MTKSFLAKRALLLTIIIPVLFSQQINAAVDDSSVKLRTVVIDAGHGGHDPGTLSPDRKVKESAINLEVALALGKKISTEYPDVKVIYTRSKDVFVPLDQRADIANKNHADLFISIHVNSAKKGSSAKGTETFVMGTDKSSSNMEVCKRENSVILLEDDYSTTYQGFDPNNAESYIFFNLMQNAHFEQSIALASLVQQNLKKGPVTSSRGIKQAPLMVLWRTTMPSILVEIGFLSNAADRKILVNKSQRALIADRIFRAFCTFKKQYDSHVEFNVGDSELFSDDDQDEDDLESTPVRLSEEISEKDDVKPAVNTGKFHIQIFATSKKLKAGDSRFKGMNDCDCRFVNGMYKYSVGNYSTKQEAMSELSSVKKNFPEAFVVSF